MEEFEKGTLALPGVLSSMGYESLRPGQQEPVDRLMLGYDVLAILPTGGGKTLIHACVTKALNHKTIVFSPLVALMQDQVQSLNRKGVRSAAVNSAQAETLNTSSLQRWAEEKLDVMFVAPERMDNPQFIAAMNMCPPSFVVADEAHSISQYSAVFRPAYGKIGTFISKYNPRLVLAITATATNEIVNDIKRVLTIDNCVICKYLPARRNIELHSQTVTDQDLFHHVLKRLKQVNGSCIVYCSTVTEVENLTQFLDSMGEEVTFYHGKIQSPAMKAMNQDEFMEGRKRIMVATNAFGMGIDKADIRCIIHASPPGSVEAIAQETGRAARDGGPASCYMFCTEHGLSMQRYLFMRTNPTGATVKRVWNYLDARKDKNGDVAIPVDQIAKDLNLEDAQGAVNMLTNLECIHRFSSDKDVRQLFVNPASEPDNDTQTIIFNAIKEGGVNQGKTSAGWEVYEIDMDYIVRAVGKTQPTVMKHLKQMSNDNKLVVPVKFRGKITHLLRQPTEEDIHVVNVRYRTENKKLEDVLKYITMPDEQKHDFITHYFDLENE